MAKLKKPLMLDGPYMNTGCYVKAWKEGRQEIVVQVWLGLTPVGEPAGDWSMPKVLGVSGCVEQAIAQTRDDAERAASKAPPKVKLRGDR